MSHNVTDGWTDKRTVKTTLITMLNRADVQ